MGIYFIIVVIIYIQNSVECQYIGVWQPNGTNKCSRFHNACHNMLMSDVEVNYGNDVVLPLFLVTINIVYN
jgi:hypothetical protein